jgi:hypothetical protein
MGRLTGVKVRAVTKKGAFTKERRQQLSAMTASKTHPGLELDAHGKRIPNKDRHPEDRAKTKAARKWAAVRQKS